MSEIFIFGFSFCHVLVFCVSQVDPERYKTKKCLNMFAEKWVVFMLFSTGRLSFLTPIGFFDRPQHTLQLTPEVLGVLSKGNLTDAAWVRRSEICYGPSSIESTKEF